MMETAACGNEEEVKILREKLHEVMVERDKVKAERDDYRDRYKKLATQVTRRNNPAIEDLSDPNRPVMLVEAFQELYSNEWAGAYTTLKKEGYDLTRICTTLFELIKSCFHRSVEEADLVRKDLVQVAIQKLVPPPSKLDKTGDKVKKKKVKSQSREKHPMERADTEVEDKTSDKVKKKKVKSQSREKPPMEKADTEPEEDAVIQSAAIEFMKCIWMHSSKPIPPKICHVDLDVWKAKKFKKVRLYIERCAELCWLMKIQVPPIMLDCSIKQDDSFDPTFHAKYIEAGNTIDFPIWPVMLHANDKRILSKGIVYCKSS